MPDLFKEKASDWDANEFRSQLSSAIGSAILEYVPLDEKMTVMDFGAGTGLLTSHVTPRVKSIAAVDISAAMLDKLVAKPEFQAKVIAINRTKLLHFRDHWSKVKVTATKIQNGRLICASHYVLLNISDTV